MPPQTLTKRLERLCSDIYTDPTVDIAARWAKIAETVGAEAAAALGPIPEPTLDEIPLQKAISYACRDADATLRLHPILDAKIDEFGLRQALELDEAVLPMVQRMCANGMLVDRDHLATLDFAFTSALVEVEHRCWEAAGRQFLVTSADQVAEVLFGDLGLRGGRLTPSKKRYSTDEKTLTALRGKHPIISLLQEHREISKLQSSYVEVLPKLLSPDGRIRMELGMVTVPSGRLNCWGGVNLLAIPVRTELGREIRRAFRAPPGCRLGSIDLSQIELRALAVMSGDERLLDAFLHDKDLHAITAAEAIFHIPISSVTFEQRDRGKRMNFQIPYGISALGLLEQFHISGITDIDEVGCQKLLDDWYSFYSDVLPWMEAVYAEGRRNGYIRDTLSGRILWTPGLRSPIDKVKAEAERIAIAWKCQTFAQVILKLGMVQMWGFLQEWWRSGYDRLEPLLQVHDEILLEASTDIEEDMLTGTLVELVVGAAPKLPIPIKAGCTWGANWKELK